MNKFDEVKRQVKNMKTFYYDTCDVPALIMLLRISDQLEKIEKRFAK